MRRDADGMWVATTEAEVRAVLRDATGLVPEAGPAGGPGTVGWLRASVSRFVNGPAHEQRRATAERELVAVDPVALERDARAAALAELDVAPGTRIDVMATLSFRAPATALAAALGASDPQSAAAATADCAAGYFPGAGAEPAVERRADTATATLLEVFRGTPLDVAVARIALLVQGCDATAGLIGMALATDLDVEAVLRRLPPVRVMRRVAGAAVEIGAAAIEAGDPIRCDLDSASDPAVLTFGDGPRSCPGPSHARALATGVISAVRATCTRVDEPVEYRPVAALRLPRHVHVIRR